MKLKKKRAFLLSILTPLRGCLDAENCTKWLAAEFHTDSVPACPSCGEVPSGSTAAILSEGRRVRCRSCGKGFTIWSGTPFEGAKITPEEFVLMRVALAAGLDFTGLREITGHHGQCITAWTRKIEEFNQAKDGSNRIGTEATNDLANAAARQSEAGGSR